MGARARSPLAWLAIISLIIVGAACWFNYTAPRAADFVSFWAASQLSGPGAYDLAAHRAVQLSVVPMPGLLPFPYPPPFLLIVAPFGLLAYPIAIVAWVVATGGLYLLATRKLIWFAHPAVIPSGLKGFLDMAWQFSAYLAAGSWPWEKLASVYAFARYFGAGSGAAMALHVVIALGATALVARAWSSGSPHKVAVLASATLLVPPYLLSYDYLLLAVPFMALIARPALAIPLWILAALPVAGFFSLYDGPNTMPLAALASLAALAFDESSRPTPSDGGDAPSLSATPFAASDDRAGGRPATLRGLVG